MEVVKIEPIMYVELNAFSLVILVLIYFNVRYRRDQLLTEQRLFLLLLYMQAAILVLDALMWLLDGVPGTTALGFNTAATALYYILNPAICMGWYFYVDYQIYKDEGHLKKVLVPIALPALVNLCLTVASIFNGALFYFDENNVYHRGKLFLVMAASAFFYLIYTWVFTMVKRKMISKQEFLPIAIFMLPPIIGGVIQVLYYGVSLIWACTTISILIIFINIQNAMLYTDHLTGLFNRRQLDRYLLLKMQSAESGTLAGLMIDINTFKDINDRYGHTSGDQALVHTAEILKSTFRKGDFIARFGGDEFVVIMEVQQKDDLEKAVTRLNDKVAKFNAQKKAPYTISLSIGYDAYLDKSKYDANAFIKHLDGLMYKRKHGNSAEKRQND